ncbi:MAG: TonB-dependent receptor [Bacteroidetes bacterium]|nr:TonB-dependent receptor [Bacteroidota bacterium]
MNYSKIAFAFLFLIFMSGTLISQPQNRNNPTDALPSGIITGRVVDNDGKKPIARATVTAHHPETNRLIKGGYTDKQGKFSLNVNDGNYTVEVKFVGYDTVFVRNISISSSKQEHNCGDLTLKMVAIQQAEIQVVAQREAIEVGLDRKVFNIEQDASNIGGSALDVLANIPSVTVDQDDNVSLRGNSNVKVLIDGRVSNLTASEALEQIPSTMVSSVELITNPGARYDADGTAGMINIVTTRQRDDGFNGMVNLNGGLNQAGEPRYSGSIAANLNTGKWNFFVNISSRLGNRSGESERNRYLLNSYGDTLQTLKQEGNNKGGGQGFRGKIGADYNFSKDDVLTYTFNAGANRRLSNNESKYWVYDNEDIWIDYYTRAEDNQSPFGTNFEHTLSYKHNFEDKGHELYVDLYYNGHNREWLTYYNQYNFFAPNFDSSIYSKQQNVSSTISNIYTTQFDYARPIGTNFKLEAGGKYYNRKGDIDNHLDNLVNNIWVVDTNRKNEFRFTEQIIAGYVTGSTKLFDAIKTNVGVRVETTIMDFNAILAPELSFKNDYTMLFPSVYLAYDLNINHQVSANFSSRMRRPNHWDLNPVTNYEDPLNLRKGNPELEPESHYNFEFGYLMNYDVSTLTATLFHRYSTDVIESYKSVVQGDTTLSMPMNISTASRTGFEFIYMYKIFESWKADANFSLYSYSIDARDIGADKKTAFNWTARINSQLDLLEKFLNITLSANIRSKMLRAQGEFKGNWNMDASFRLNFSRQFNISLRLQDIFNTMQWGGFEDIPGVLYSETNTKFNSRGFVLGLSYRFNDYKQKRERNLDDGRMDEGD